MLLFADDLLLLRLAPKQQLRPQNCPREGPRGAGGNEVGHGGHSGQVPQDRGSGV